MNKTKTASSNVNKKKSTTKPRSKSIVKIKKKPEELNEKKRRVKIEILKAPTKKSVPERLLDTVITGKVWFGGLFIGFLFSVLYISTAPVTNVSYADSDELLAIAYNMGVAHPPGYSLYMLLLHWFLHLPIPGTIAFKGHVLSALFQGGALTFIFVTVWRLIEYIQVNATKKISIITLEKDRWLLSVIATILLGSSFLYWLYGSITEKYAFNNLLIALLIWLSVTFLTSQRHLLALSYWIGLGIVSGLALSHHQTTILLFPLVGAVMYFVRPRLQHEVSVFLVSGVGVFALSLGVLFWQNTLPSSVSWNFEPTFQGLVDHVTRKDFGTTGNETVFSAYIPSVDISGMVKTLPVYLKTLVQHFGYVTILITVVGAIVLWQRSKRLGKVLVIQALIVTVLFPLYLKWPVNIGTQAITMRQYLMGYMVVPLLLSGGWLFVLARLSKVLEVAGIKRHIGYGILLFIAIVLPAYKVINTYSKVNLRSFTIVHDLHKHILEDLPQNSMLACFTDLSCFALLYAQEVEHTRPDVILVPAAHPLVHSKLESYQGLRGFTYPDDPYLTLDYLTWNIGKRSVFVVDMTPDFFDLLGTEYSFTYLIPYGYYGELTRRVPDELPVTSYELTDRMYATKVPPEDLMGTFVKSTFARFHVTNASIYQKMANRNRARDELNIAANLMFQVPQASPQEIEMTRTSIESTLPVINYKPGSTNQGIEDILKIVNDYLEKGRLQKAYIGARGTIVIDPLTEEGRLKLAEIHERMGDRKFALLEYKHVLLYHPENETAQQKVKELQSINFK